MIEAFKNALTKPIKDVERGDVILFKDLKSGEWQRGIVYRIILHPDNSGVTGFLTVPVDTVVKNDNRNNTYPSIAKINSVMVEKVGGNPAIHKLVLPMNLRTVVNNSRMTGLSVRDEVRTLGSFHGEPFMKELSEQIELHYYSRTLHKDGRLVEANERRIIVPVITAIDEAKESSRSRRQTYQKLQQEKDNFGGTSIGGKIVASVQTLSLESAVENGHIQKRSYEFLKAASMANGQTPATISDAFDLVTKNPDRLAAVYGLGSKGKIYQNIITDVTGAMAALSPKTPEA